MKTSRVSSKTGSSAAIEPAPRLSAKEQTQAGASPYRLLYFAQRHPAAVYELALLFCKHPRQRPYHPPRGFTKPLLPLVVLFPVPSFFNLFHTCV